MIYDNNNNNSENEFLSPGFIIKSLIAQGQSVFWRRKMRTLHSHLDVNKDGVISYEDFMLLADRFADIGHLTPEAKKEFQKVLSVSFKFKKFFLP